LGPPKKSPVARAKKENLQFFNLAVRLLTTLLTALLTTLAGLLVRLLTLLIVFLATAALLLTALLVLLIGHQLLLGVDAKRQRDIAANRSVSGVASLHAKPPLPAAPTCHGAC
jgi:hypothetical protein